MQWAKRLSTLINITEVCMFFLPLFNVLVVLWETKKFYLPFSGKKCWSMKWKKNIKHLYYVYRMLKDVRSKFYGWVFFLVFKNWWNLMLQNFQVFNLKCFYSFFYIFLQFRNLVIPFVLFIFMQIVRCVFFFKIIIIIIIKP